MPGLSALGIPRWAQLMQQDVEILHLKTVSNEAESTPNLNVPVALQNWVTKYDRVGYLDLVVKELDTLHGTLVT